MRKAKRLLIPLFVAVSVLSTSPAWAHKDKDKDKDKDDRDYGKKDKAGSAPINGGISFLVAAGLSIGLIKLYQESKKRQQAI